MTHLRKFLALTFAFSLVVACPMFAGAQSWPDKPIKLIVGLAAGGGTDVLARVVA